MPQTRAFPRWLHCPKPDPGARLRLLCFHYAGGSAQAFRSWADSFRGLAEVSAIQLPGRMDRHGEALARRLEVLVPAMVDGIGDVADRPIICFGHSMGSLIAFEFARELRRRGLAPPQVLFVASRGAPPVSKVPPTKHLTDDELISHLRSRYGESANMELLDDPSVRAFFLPVLRADLELLETYEYRPEPPLDIPIVAIASTQDPWISQDTMKAWKDTTTKQFELWEFPGGHFFWQPRADELLARISAYLKNL